MVTRYVGFRRITTAVTSVRPFVSLANVARRGWRRLAGFMAASLLPQPHSMCGGLVLEWYCSLFPFS